jgi:ankyrin repeat protein/outer membrane protein assembly factor BamB
MKRRLAVLLFLSPLALLFTAKVPGLAGEKKLNPPTLSPRKSAAPPFPANKRVQKFPGKLNWKFRTASEVVSSPEVSGDTVFVGSSDGYLYALDLSTGALRWKFETGAEVVSSPAVAGGTVYVGSHDHHLYAVDDKTGKMRWKHETGNAVRSSPAVSGGTVYVGSNDGYLYAFDGSTGSVRWKFRTGGPVISSPSVSGGTVYAGSTDGRLYSLNAASGEVRWTFDTGALIFSSPVIAEGLVITGNDEGMLHALVEATGEVRWKFKGPGTFFFRGLPAVAGDTLYAVEFDSLHALSLARGESRWQRGVGKRAHSSPAPGRELLYIGSSHRLLHGIDPDTGEVRWEFRTGAPVFSSPVVNGGLVVAGCSDGYVYALAEADLSGEPMDQGPWTMSSSGRPLFQLVHKDAREEITALLRKGADLEATDAGGNTPLMSATRQGRREMAALLIDHGADLEAANRDGETALAVAVKERKAETAALLLERGAATGSRTRYGETPLMNAARKGDSAMIGLLLSAGANPDEGDIGEGTPLLRAIWKGEEEPVRLLLDGGADVNAVAMGNNPWLGSGWSSDPLTRSGYFKVASFLHTPLMAAVERRRAEWVRTLLDRGAKVNRDEGVPPLLYALGIGQHRGGADLPALLINAGADVNASWYGDTPLMYASERWVSPMLVRSLLEKGADPNAVNEAGRTPLMFARSTEAASLLVEAGAEVNARDGLGYTPLMYAVMSRRAATVKLLVSWSADVNAATADGRTALMLTAAAEKDQAAPILLEAGAAVDLRDSRGSTALLYAAHYSNGPVMKHLIDAGADVMAVNTAGESALILAARAGEPAAGWPLVGRLRDMAAPVDLLVGEGVDVDSRDGEGRTALMNAVLSGRGEIVVRLLHHGADVDLRDSGGRTALVHAASREGGRRGVDIVRLLLDTGADTGIPDVGGKKAIDLAENHEIIDMLSAAALRGSKAVGEAADEKSLARHEKRLAYLYLLRRNSGGSAMRAGMGVAGEGGDIYHDVTRVGTSSKREISYEDLTIHLDLSTQVLGLDVPEDKEYSWRGDGDNLEAPVYPTIDKVPGVVDFGSAALFAAKAKQVDDGIYAALEHLVQEGDGTFVGRRELLKLVSGALRALPPEEEGEALGYARSFIAAAASLGGEEIREDPAVIERAESIASDFLADELRSKPVGFYTWSDSLQRIFRQDRLLQQPFVPLEQPQARASIAIFAAGLAGERARKAYLAYHSLVEKLTNPYPPEYRDMTLSEPVDEKMQYAFFPPSRSTETELMKHLFGPDPETERMPAIPEGFSLVDALIEKVRGREIDLSPKPDSGWYDYQVWALEPLLVPDLMPGAEKLSLGTGYRRELTELFKSLIALTRETHVKQLEGMRVGAAMPPVTVKIYPLLSLEPLPAYYLRRALAYRFVRDLLRSTFREETLRKARRLKPGGASPRPLLDEIGEMESLFLGAARLAADEIGMELSREIAGPMEGPGKGALRWIHDLASDPDVGADQRMMVPLFYDLQRKKIKVWAFLGYSAKPLKVWFEKRPSLRVEGGEGRQVNFEFKDLSRFLLTPISAEVYVERLLDRDEFRALCDRHRTRSAIIRALEKI